MASENKRDFEIPVTLGETDVTVIIHSNERTRERARDMYNQLCIMRGIPNPDSITIRDEEVRRILKKKGIDPNHPKSGTRTQIIVRGVIRAVQSFHTQNRNATFLIAYSIAGMEDIFQSRDGKLLPKLRPDVAAIVPRETIERIREEHFAEPDMDEETLSMSPDPVIRDSASPVEQMVVLMSAVVETFPDIQLQMEQARDHMARAEIEEGGVETDDNNFHTQALD